MIDCTPFLRLYARHRIGSLTSQDPVLSQQQQLLALTRRAASTRFGKEHEFSAIKSVRDYQERVPLRRYEEFWNDYWKAHFPLVDNITWPGRIPYFSVSSGTSSGKTKYIPYTREMIRSNTKAGTDLMVYHIDNRPQSGLLRGKSFFLGGSTALIEEAPGVFSGDLSGIAAKTLPWWAAMRFFPPPELALMTDWESKISTLAERSLAQEIRMLSGVPSWLLIFIKKLEELRPDSGGKLVEIYPHLDLLVHGGVNFAPYLKQFQNILEGSDAEMREVYPASEGFVAVADRSYGEGLRLNIDHHMFFEFVPLEELAKSNPTRHWTADIERDVNYAVVLSSAAGLWSYILGDTVRFVETRPPRLLVTGRTSYYLSAFGEHLIAEEIEDAVARAGAKLGLAVSDYSVGPLYPQTAGELGGHLYIIELARQPESEIGDRDITAAETTARIAHEIDLALCERNDDYRAHRAEGYGLNIPLVRIVEPGFFAAWMKARNKLGGQNKVPRIITDTELLDSLRNFKVS